MNKYLSAIFVALLLCAPIYGQSAKANASNTFGSGSTGSSPPFTDASAIVMGSADNTKLGIFNVSGLTTGTTRTFTMPDASGTIPLLTNTATFTNKTLASSTNTLGGVTMGLGSDATGDIHFSGASNVLTRLAIGTSGQCLLVSGGLPAWGSCGGGGGSAPAGSGSELQFRSNSTTLGALTGSSVSSSTLTLTGRLNLTPSATNVTPLVVNVPSGSTSDPIVVQFNGTQFAAFTQRSTLSLSSRNNTGTEANGDIWQSNDQKTMAFHIFGRDFYMPTVLFTTANSLNTSSASETSIVGSTGIGSRTFTANIGVIGKHVCVDGDGYYSTTGSPATLTIKAKLGSTVIATTGAVTPAASATDQHMTVHVCFPVRASGSGGTVQAQGHVTLVDSAGVTKTFGLVNTSTVAVDLSVDQTLDVTATWGSAIGGQSVTFTGFRYSVAN